MIKRITLLVALASFSLAAKSQCASSANIYSFTHNGKSYEVIKELKNWNLAASCALARGGYLVEINDAAEQTAVYNSIAAAGVASNYTTVSSGGGIAYVWIGGTDQATEGTWLWNGDNTGTTTHFWTGEGAAGNGGGSAVMSRYNNWGRTSSGTINEPDDFQNNQDGLGIALSSWPYGTAGQWNDIASSFSLYYIVEYDCAATSDTVTTSSCSGYTTPSGKIISSTGNYSDTIPNSAGCDSIITIQFTSTAGASSVAATICDSYTTPNGQVITATGIYYDSLTTAGGCDSLVTFTITKTLIDTTISLAADTLNANYTVSGVTYQWLDCDNNYAVITGSTMSSFSSLSGNFAVEITDGNCVDTTQCMTLASTSILEQNESIEFELFPNPAQNNVFIQTKNGQNEVVKIYTQVGKLVIAQQIIGNSVTQIDLSTLSPGIYVISLAGKTKKLVVTN